MYNHCVDGRPAASGALPATTALCRAAAKTDELQGMSSLLTQHVDHHVALHSPVMQVGHHLGQLREGSDIQRRHGEQERWPALHCCRQLRLYAAWPMQHVPAPLCWSRPTRSTHLLGCEVGGPGAGVEVSQAKVHCIRAVLHCCLQLGPATHRGQHLWLVSRQRHNGGPRGGTAAAATLAAAAASGLSCRHSSCRAGLGSHGVELWVLALLVAGCIAGAPLLPLPGSPPLRGRASLPGRRRRRWRTTAALAALLVRLAAAWGLPALLLRPAGPPCGAHCGGRHSHARLPPRLMPSDAHNRTAITHNRRGGPCMGTGVLAASLAGGRRRLATTVGSLHVQPLCGGHLQVNTWHHDSHRQFGLDTQHQHGSIRVQPPSCSRGKNGAEQAPSSEFCKV